MSRHASLTAGLSAICLILAAGVGSASADTIVIEADLWCPYTCQPDSEKPGFMIDVAKAVFEPLGHQVVYRLVPWTRALEDVREKRTAQGAAGATINDRDDALVFHDEPLGSSANLFVTRPHVTWTFTGAASLDGRRLGIVKDYTYGSPVDEWVKAHGAETEAVSGDNALELNLKKLVAQRIDTVVDDGVVLTYVAAQAGLTAQLRPAGTTEANDVFIAFSKAGNGPRYAEVLSKGIASLRTDGRLAAILARYGVKDWK